jgi:hypothetical protein
MPAGDTFARARPVADADRWSVASTLPVSFGAQSNTIDPNVPEVQMRRRFLGEKRRVYGRAARIVGHGAVTEHRFQRWVARLRRASLS